MTNLARQLLYIMLVKVISRWVEILDRYRFLYNYSKILPTSARAYAILAIN